MKRRWYHIIAAARKTVSHHYLVIAKLTLTSGRNSEKGLGEAEIIGFTVLDALE